jgi:hypothetical protein
MTSIRRNMVAPLWSAAISAAFFLFFLLLLSFSFFSFLLSIVFLPFRVFWRFPPIAVAQSRSIARGGKEKKESGGNRRTPKLARELAPPESIQRKKRTKAAILAALQSCSCKGRNYLIVAVGNAVTSFPVNVNDAIFLHFALQVCRL